jgi:hypothetical protein
MRIVVAINDAESFARARRKAEIMTASFFVDNGQSPASPDFAPTQGKSAPRKTC